MTRYGHQKRSSTAQSASLADDGSGVLPRTARVRQSAISRTTVGLLTCAVFLFCIAPQPGDAWTWVPSEQEIGKYRRSWNPFSHGPILHTAVDIQPKGQYLLRPFIFSQIGEHSFDNRLRFFSERQNGPVHLYSVQEPSLEFAYGFTDHIQLGGTTSLQSFWARENGKTDTDTGPGDTNIAIKYRPVVQDSDSWRPSFTLLSQFAIPTGKWLGTQKPPGGFAPIGRLPATRFGEVAFTEGVMMRKNRRPFRIQAGVFYTYGAPGSEGTETTYTGDLVNTRVAFEHILDDRRGFGYGLELVTLHGLPWRVDGHEINRGQRSGFSVIAVEPTLQWRFGQTNFVGAVGVLFTVAGQNASESIYPNLSIFYYWSESGKVLMR
ncbi:MAG: hypothetical protein HY581_07310 [Nitrospirae bacterium]|nr:hypothetical protein [Nitrospirota bacterium]